MSIPLLDRKNLNIILMLEMKLGKNDIILNYFILILIIIENNKMRSNYLEALEWTLIIILMIVKIGVGITNILILLY